MSYRFLKQYGERRTGTNFLRALLQANFPDLNVLMHVLGDKHSPPVPFAAILQQAGRQPNPALAFVTEATFQAPAKTSRSDDHRQLAYLRQLAPDLYTAASTGKLGFIISVKNPWAWAASIGRWYAYGNALIRARYTAQEWVEMFEKEVAHFNLVYQAWWTFRRLYPDQTIFVRYEDLLQKPEATLTTIAAHYDLPFPSSLTLQINQRIPPMNWDYQPLPTGKGKFNHAYYKANLYRPVVPPPLATVLSEKLDWALMAGYGYEKVVQPLL